MKVTAFAIFTLSGLLAVSHADPVAEKPLTEAQKAEAEKAKALETHRTGSEKASIDQDKQSANAAELIDEQTDAKVIELLSHVESLMGETTDLLEDGDTGGDTIAIQTEIIEKIYEAAKQKAQSGSPSPGSQQNMDAMLGMMEQMMGKSQEYGQGKENDNESDAGGDGERNADSDSANDTDKGPSNNQRDKERRVPKAAGKSGTSLPAEFQKALDAYNKTLKTP